MDAVVLRLREALDAWSGGALRPSRVVAYVGKGNNAGDAEGLAASYGCPVLLRGVCPPEDLSADTRRQLERVARWEALDVAPVPAPGTLILDGLLGSGATGALRPGLAALVEEMNALRESCPRSVTVAIDIPTGLVAGEGPVVLADVTAPVGCVKPPMLADGAEDAVGQILPVALPEVAIPAESADGALDAAAVRAWLPRRAFSCFKNRAGRVAVVAGSPGMTGAAQMTAEAALAAGAGLVTLYARGEAYPVLAGRVAPEVMVRRIESFSEVETAGAQALLVGPGLGRLAPEEAEALHALLAGFEGTVALDADGLNAAAAGGWDLDHPRWILTPHPGEMRRLAPELAGLPRREQAGRFLASRRCVLLLKGARSLVAQGEACWFNGTGGPFMANGGQGDVLAGVVAGLAAQGLSPLHAAAAGAHVCGLAATQAWLELGTPRAVRATQTLARVQALIS